MRMLQGTVTSNKMQKTVVVRVDRLVRHPKYQKYYRLSQKCKADAESGKYQIGDVVVIKETRPGSREKRWQVTALVKRAASENAEEETL